MDLKKHLIKAWELTLKFIIPLILITLVMVVISVLTFGILAPVVGAGYMQSLLLMIRQDREPQIPDLFTEMKLFFPLLLFGLAAFVAILIGFSLFFFPGLLVILALIFCCLYMVPLMIDKKMGLIEAVKESYQMAFKGNVGEHVVIAILVIGISAIGSSFILGTLFTQPLATVFLLLIYNEKVGKSNSESVVSS